MTLLGGLSALASYTGTPVHHWYKMVQVIFLIGTVVLIARRSSIEFAAAVMLCLLANSVIFESADIFYSLPLVAALMCFLRGSYVWFSLLFALSALVKWQPLILAPFLAAHFLLSTEFAGIRERAKVILMNCLLPAAVVVIPIAAVFGPEMFLSLFKATGAKFFLTGNALNMNYAMGWLYAACSGMIDLQHIVSASKILSLNPPDFVFADKMPAFLWTLSKVLFLTFSAVTAWIYLRLPKSRENALICAAVFIFVYGMFNTEVHENHLHLAIAALVPLALQMNLARSLMLYVGALVSANLLLYLSPWKDGFYFVSFSFLIAVLNVSVLLYVLIELLSMAGKAKSQVR